MTINTPVVGAVVRCTCGGTLCKAEGRVMRITSRFVWVAWVVDKEGHPMFEIEKTKHINLVQDGETAH